MTPRHYCFCGRHGIDACLRCARDHESGMSVTVWRCAEHKGLHEKVHRMGGTHLSLLVRDAINAQILDRVDDL